MLVFRKKNWTGHVYIATEADWEEIMPYEKLTTIINDGTLKRTLEESSDPDIKNLVLHLPR